MCFVNPCLLHMIKYQQVRFTFPSSQIYDLPSSATVNIIQSREQYHLLTRMSAVSNYLLVFLRDNFGIESENCIRNLLILIFTETRELPEHCKEGGWNKSQDIHVQQVLNLSQRKGKKIFWASCQWHEISHPLLQNLIPQSNFYTGKKSSLAV